jgi:hypothetical protein
MNKVSVVRHWWPVGAQLVGVVTIAVGLGLLALWAGVVAAGVGMVVIGTIAEIGPGN